MIKIVLGSWLSLNCFMHLIAYFGSHSYAALALLFQPFAWLFFNWILLFDLQRALPHTWALHKPFIMACFLCTVVKFSNEYFRELSEKDESLLVSYGLEGVLELSLFLCVLYWKKDYPITFNRSVTEPLLGGSRVHQGATSTFDLSNPLILEAKVVSFKIKDNRLYFIVLVYIGGKAYSRIKKHLNEFKRLNESLERDGIHIEFPTVRLSMQDSMQKFSQVREELNSYIQDIALADPPKQFLDFLELDSDTQKLLLASKRGNNNKELLALSYCSDRESKPSGIADRLVRFLT